MGFDRDTLIESLRNRVQNEVTFFLLPAKFVNVTTNMLLIPAYFPGYCGILLAIGQQVS